MEKPYLNYLRKRKEVSFFFERVRPALAAESALYSDKPQDLNAHRISIRWKVVQEQDRVSCI